MLNSIINHCNNGIRKSELVKKLTEEGYCMSNPREFAQMLSLLETLVDTQSISMIEYITDSGRECFYISSGRVLVVKVH